MAKRKLGPGELVKRVARYLATEGSARNAESIAAAIKRGKPETYGVLSDMMRKGRVTKERTDGVNVYTLTAEAETVASIKGGKPGHAYRGGRTVDVNARQPLTADDAEYARTRNENVEVDVNDLDALNDALGQPDARGAGSAAHKLIGNVQREAVRREVEDLATVLHAIVTNAKDAAPVASLVSFLRTHLGNWAVAQVMGARADSVDLVSHYPVAKLKVNGAYGKQVKV